jgi:hypothetical protein
MALYPVQLSTNPGRMAAPFAAIHLPLIVSLLRDSYTMRSLLLNKRDGSEITSIPGEFIRGNCRKFRMAWSREKKSVANNSIIPHLRAIRIFRVIRAQMDLGE